MEWVVSVWVRYNFMFIVPCLDCVAQAMMSACCIVCVCDSLQEEADVFLTSI